MLEQVALDPLVAAAASLLGVLLGLLLGRLFLPGPREVKRLQGEIERLGREHAEYQGRVAGHFQKTGELIGQMTQSYKAVYDHLADGAQTLCTADALPKPAFAAPRLIVDDTVTVGDGLRGPLPAAESPRADGDAASALRVSLNEPVDEPAPIVTPLEGGTRAPEENVKPV